jgi:hypothetical protein
MVSVTAAFILPLVWEHQIPQIETKFSYVSMVTKGKAEGHGLHLLVVQFFIRPNKSAGSTFLVQLEHRVKGLDLVEVVLLGQRLTQRIIIDTYDGSRRGHRRDRRDRRANWWIVASV